MAAYSRRKEVKAAEIVSAEDTEAQKKPLEQESDMTEAAMNETPSPATPARATNGDAHTRQAQLHWDDGKMATSFANVVNIQSTREQVDLFFGTNQTWNAANEKTLSIELSNRVILSPFAAKRLSVALAGVLREYEMRYGALDVDR
jgi:hypothetical protein